MKNEMYLLQAFGPAIGTGELTEIDLEKLINYSNKVIAGDHPLASEYTESFDESYKNNVYLDASYLAAAKGAKQYVINSKEMQELGLIDIILNPIYRYHQILIQEIRNIQNIPKPKIEITDILLVVMKDGDYVPPHNHHSHISSAYHLAVPDNLPYPDGAINFMAHSSYCLPDFKKDIYDNNYINYPAEKGKFFMFPGKLTHSVNPFRGPGTRISLVVDANVQFN